MLAQGKRENRAGREARRQLKQHMLTTLASLQPQAFRFRGLAPALHKAPQLYQHSPRSIIHAAQPLLLLPDMRSHPQVASICNPTPTPDHQHMHMVQLLHWPGRAWACIGLYAMPVLLPVLLLVLH